MTQPPTRDELVRMLEQCVGSPESNVWNWKVADLLRHYLRLHDDHKALLKKVHSLGRHVQSLDAALAACEQGE